MEKDVGIEVYLTATDGLGGKIKASPEDFIVEEIPMFPPREDGGGFTVALIRSRNWETNRLVRMMSRELRISRKRIRFAGTKDKRAITTQMFQFEVAPQTVRELRLKDVELLELYETSKEIDIGDLRGNRFDVRISGIRMDREDIDNNAQATLAALKEAGGFPNFFGMQRFGSFRPITHVVGKRIVKGDFKGAVDAYVAYPVEGEGEESFALRSRLEESSDYAEALRTYPDVMSFEKAMLNHLVACPGDYVGALKQLPFNLLMMFVHGYQSYMFNRVLSERIRRMLPLNEPLEGDVLMPIGRENLPDERRLVPVAEDNIEKARTQVSKGAAFVTGILFGSKPLLASGLMGEIERQVVDSEGLRPEDFTIPSIPRLSSKGIRRPLLVRTPALDIQPSDGSVRMKFELPRGCYATAMLREFMKVENLEG